jgi:hypothetical protein
MNLGSDPYGHYGMLLCAGAALTASRGTRHISRSSF